MKKQFYQNTNCEVLDWEYMLLNLLKLNQSIAIHEVLKMLSNVLQGSFQSISLFHVFASLERLFDHIKTMICDF